MGPRLPPWLSNQGSDLHAMMLQDGTKKMSKSAESDASRINLLDPPDILYGKIKRAKTDGKLLHNPSWADVNVHTCNCTLPSAG